MIWFAGDSACKAASRLGERLEFIHGAQPRGQSTRIQRSLAERRVYGIDAAAERCSVTRLAEGRVKLTEQRRFDTVARSRGAGIEHFGIEVIVYHALDI